jgi:hypothetical protein
VRELPEAQGDGLMPANPWDDESVSPMVLEAPKHSTIPPLWFFGLLGLLGAAVPLALGSTIEGLERSTYMTREQQDFAAWERRDERLFNTRYVLALDDGRVVTVSGLAMALLDRNEAFLLSGGAGRARGRRG